jgi:hypothetical protein
MFVQDSLMIPAPKGQYPPAEQYRLNNEDQLITSIPRSVQVALALLSFLRILCITVIENAHPPDQQVHAIKSGKINCLPALM